MAPLSWFWELPQLLQPNTGLSHGFLKLLQLFRNIWFTLQGISLRETSSFLSSVSLLICILVLFTSSLICIWISKTEHLFGHPICDPNCLLGWSRCLAHSMFSRLTIGIGRFSIHQNSVIGLVAAKVCRCGLLLEKDAQARRTKMKQSWHVILMLLQCRCFIRIICCVVLILISEEQLRRTSSFSIFNQPQNTTTHHHHDWYALDTIQASTSQTSIVGQVLHCRNAHVILWHLCTNSWTASIVIRHESTTDRRQWLLRESTPVMPCEHHHYNWHTTNQANTSFPIQFSSHASCWFDRSDILWTHFARLVCCLGRRGYKAILCSRLGRAYASYKTSIGCFGLFASCCSRLLLLAICIGRNQCLLEITTQVVDGLDSVVVLLARHQCCQFQPCTTAVSSLVQ